MCWNEDREITFSYHHRQNRLDLRKIVLIHCQLFMYLINYLGFVGKKTNTKTLRENIFLSPFQGWSLLVMLLHSGVGPTQLQGISLSQIINWHRIQYSKHPGLATVPAAGSGVPGVVALGPVLSATWSSSLRRRQDAQCLRSQMHRPLSQRPGVSVKVLSTLQHKAINNKPF